MKRTLSLVILIFSTIAFTTTTIAPSAAETLTWRVRSNHPNAVNVEFYSQDRRHAWPGGKKVYVIRDYDTHALKGSISSPFRTASYNLRKHFSM